MLIPSLKRDLHRHTGMRFIVTSYIRHDGTSHQTGLSIDLAARSGRLGAAVERRDGTVNYYADRQLLHDVKVMLAQPSQYRDCVKRVVAELDHLHIDLNERPRPWQSPKLYIYDAPRCNDLACNAGGERPYLKGPL
jgi:hypothetical protein